MNARLTLSATLLTALVFSTGCRTVNTVTPSQPRSEPHIIYDDRVIHDHSLNHRVHIVELHEDHTPDGTMKIQVVAHNRQITRQAFNYKFEWVDRHGLTMDTPLSRWTQASMAGKETITLSAVAPSRDAVDFRLKLLEPKG